MATISWDDIGERFYELGVDRGVLYVGEDDGVPWNGITAVEEQPSGGEPKAHYIDGVKFINYSAVEEFEATLSAFYSPEEFDVCDGAWFLRDGIAAMHQVRQTFGLSYRTKIGNDTEGQDHGYKIHLVWNALSEPTTHSYGTMTDTVEMQPLSWHITTSPIFFGGSVWASHLVINSLTTNPGILEQLEDILYGTPSTAPRLPFPWEIVNLVDVPIGIDGGFPEMPQTELLDGGVIPVNQPENVDGGVP